MWSLEALLAGVSFTLAFTESCFGWACAGALWLAWSVHDRKQELKEAIERTKGLN
jgi:hypothetical protein